MKAVVGISPARRDRAARFLADAAASGAYDRPSSRWALAHAASALDREEALGFAWWLRLVEEEKVEPGESFHFSGLAAQLARTPLSADETEALVASFERADEGFTLESQPSTRDRVNGRLRGQAGVLAALPPSVRLSETQRTRLAAPYRRILETLLSDPEDASFDRTYELSSLATSLHLAPAALKIDRKSAEAIAAPYFSALADGADDGELRDAIDVATAPAIGMSPQALREKGIGEHLVRALERTSLQPGPTDLAPTYLFENLPSSFRFDVDETRRLLSKLGAMIDARFAKVSATEYPALPSGEAFGAILDRLAPAEAERRQMAAKVREKWFASLAHPRLFQAMIAASSGLPGSMTPAEDPDFRRRAAAAFVSWMQPENAFVAKPGDLVGLLVGDEPLIRLDRAQMLAVLRALVPTLETEPLPVRDTIAAVLGHHRFTAAELKPLLDVLAKPMTPDHPLFQAPSLLYDAIPPGLEVPAPLAEHLRREGYRALVGLEVRQILSGALMVRASGENREDRLRSVLALLKNPLVDIQSEQVVLATLQDLLRAPKFESRWQAVAWIQANAPDVTAKLDEPFDIAPDSAGAPGRVEAGIPGHRVEHAPVQPATTRRHSSATLCRAASCAASKAFQSARPQAAATSGLVSSGGSSDAGETSRNMTSIRVSSRSAGSISSRDQAGRDQLLERVLEMRVEADAVPELKRVDGEFEVDQAARAELDVEPAPRPPCGTPSRRASPPRRRPAAPGRASCPGSSRSPPAASAARPAEPKTGRARVSAICSQVQACSLW